MRENEVDVGVWQVGWQEEAGSSMLLALNFPPESICQRRLAKLNQNKRMRLIIVYPINFYFYCKVLFTLSYHFRKIGREVTK